MRNLKSRIEKLEVASSKGDYEKSPWVIVYSDDDEIPEGVKAYHPDANPDLWDDVIDEK